MKLSIYTFVSNGLYFDFHVVQMLRHHLALADEIVVIEGYSTDGTYEAINGIDPRIRVVREKLETSEPSAWMRRSKEQARRLCTGDWCINLDVDEFFPEWEFERLRAHLTSTSRHIVRAEYKHFYGNYKVYQHRPDRPFPPKVKHIIHRNIEVEYWGDGAEVRLPGVPADDGVDHGTTFECHHFGEVRRAARLRHKWRIQQNRDWKNKWDWMPAFLFDLMPYDWFRPEVLPYLHAYEGPYIEAVRNDPSEFVRDGFKLYDHLTRTAQDGQRS